MVKKILILLRILWTAGAQRIAINKYNWLKKLGYEPELVFLRKGNAKGYEEMLKDINYKVVREGMESLHLYFMQEQSFSLGTEVLRALST
ncbi:MAG: hypothetical protein RXR51_04375 [Nitrososphaeria archaeon]